MKIQRLEITNINSLYGTHVIDFEDPAYKGCNLFAITGPTGAGKSTILDAITLGLYGRTPRLDKPSNTQSGMFSENADRCAAAVDFEVWDSDVKAPVAYRAVFEQKRTKRSDAKKPFGPPARRIERLSDNAVIASKINECDREIERLTGLDFGRFTKAALLSQGRFTAFLEADANERGQILEQLSGTDRFRLVGKAAYRINETFKQKIDLAAKRLEGMAAGVLTAAERKAVEEARDDLATRIADVAGRMTTLVERIVKRRAYDGALELADKAEKGLEKNAADVEAFKPKAAKLEAAARHDAVRVHEAASVRAAGFAKQAATDLLAAKTAADEAEKTFNKTLAARDDAKKKAAELALERPRVEAVIDAMRSSENVIANARMKAVDAGERHAKAKGLLDEVETRAKSARLGRDTAAAALKAASAPHPFVWKEADAFGFKAVAPRLSAGTADAATLKDDSDGNPLETALEGRLSELERELMKLDGGLTAVSHAKSDALSKKGEHERVAKRLEADEKDLEDAEGRLKTRVDEHAKALEEDRRRFGHDGTPEGREAARLRIAGEVERLGRERDRETLERSLARFRKALRPGSPCPLCGATDHHPEVLHAVEPGADGASAEVPSEAPLRAARDLENAFTNSTLEIARLLSMIEPAREDVERRRNAVAALREELKEAGKRHESARAGLLEAAGTFIGDASHLPGRLADVGYVPGWIDPDVVAGVDGMDADAAKAFASKLSRSTIASLSKAVTNWLSEHRRAAEKRRDAETALGEAEKALAVIDATLADRGEAAKSAASDMKAARDGLDRLLKEHQERYGTKTSQAVKAAWDERVQRIDAAKNDAEAAHEAAARKKTEAGETLAARRSAAAEREKAAAEARDVFIGSLGQSGFADDAAYRAAELDGGLREMWTREADELRREADRLAGQARAAAATIADLGGEVASGPALGMLEEERKGLAATHAGFVAEKGGLDEKIRLDDEAAGRHRTEMEALERLRADARPWDVLSSKIGSASGDKYARFAQGLTFEWVVRAANRALSELTKRYALVRDTGEPLGLLIRDAWQGEQLRTVSNLSGGETFLVSLALAMGLSKMASQHVRLDSLFIDEGFGALDPDALATTIGYLLDMKADGKLIGIISHVEALKEELPLQITVTPEGATGRSRLAGPGVRFRAPKEKKGGK